MNRNVIVKELPAYQVAYVRHVGHHLHTYQAWHTLGEWASAHGLTPPAQFSIGISLDNPEQVAEDAFRYDACITLPDGFEQKEYPNIQYQTLSGGLYAMYSFYDTVEKLADAYQVMFGEWLPASGYEADERLCMEFNMNNPAEDPEGKCKVDLYIPIKPNV
ncbi:AraC family transcriptional regulator [Brevibacillus dissolubilis]|uniref:AraC family transcriptional regulator n=1 Tax=Brevibacillus dissolubilis TaxID=1844116 RepID=UPI0011176EE1|nr:GyrI-like domain-containing protein [Brevibacillus dissolubilis]